MTIAQLGLRALVLLSVAGLGALAFRRINEPRIATTEPPVREGAPAARVPSRAKELASMQAELALVRAEMAGLKDGLAESAKLHSPTSNSESPSETVEPPKPTTPEAVQAHFDEAFEGQDVDSAWSRAEEQSIRDFVSREAGSGTRVQRLECRSTMCRLELKFESDAARSAFRVWIGEPPLDTGGFFRLDDETGLTYYAARAGHELPSLAELDSAEPSPG